MASKPILFNTEMVRAILDGRKTQTRRIVKPPYYVDTFGKPITVRSAPIGSYVWRKVGGMPYPETPYKTGDILWVRETWLKADDGYYYKADIEVPSESEDLRKAYGYKWKPSIHMPREAARIFLGVTNVRVERLQEITPKDAWNEGCRIGNSFSWEKHIPELQQQCRDILFKSLWDSIYAAPKAVINSEGEILYYESYPWEDIQETREFKGKPWYVHGNPWVWVYEFERTEKP